MTTNFNAEGPFIVWENGGTEGWYPRSYKSLKEAVLGQKHNSEFVITRLIEFVVVEAATY